MDYYGGFGKSMFSSDENETNDQSLSETENDFQNTMVFDVQNDVAVTEDVIVQLEMPQESSVSFNQHSLEQPEELLPVSNNRVISAVENEFHVSSFESMDENSFYPQANIEKNNSDPISLSINDSSKSADEAEVTNVESPPQEFIQEPQITGPHSPEDMKGINNTFIHQNYRESPESLSIPTPIPVTTKLNLKTDFGKEERPLPQHVSDDMVIPTLKEEETGDKDMNPKEDMPIKSARATYDIDAALGLFMI